MTKQWRAIPYVEFIKAQLEELDIDELDGNIDDSDPVALQVAYEQAEYLMLQATELMERLKRRIGRLTAATTKAAL